MRNLLDDDFFKVLSRTVFFKVLSRTVTGLSSTTIGRMSSNSAAASWDMSDEGSATTLFLSEVAGGGTSETEIPKFITRSKLSRDGFVGGWGCRRVYPFWGCTPLLALANGTGAAEVQGGGAIFLTKCFLGLERQLFIYFLNFANTNMHTNMTL